MPDISLKSSPPTETVLDTFARLGLSIQDTDPTSAIAGTSTTSKKKRNVYTDGENGQRVDLDSNYLASQYLGRKCEMTLFDPNKLPPTLLEGIRPLIDRDNVTSSFEYEADLMIYEGCWRRSQTEGFQSYLAAPADAKPLSKVMTKRRAMAVLFDLFGDPPKEWKDQADTELSSYRDVARFLFHLRKSRPRLVDRESSHGVHC
jgi:hypothetical protein